MAKTSSYNFILLLKTLSAWSFGRDLRSFGRPFGKEGDSNEKCDLFYL